MKKVFFTFLKFLVSFLLLYFLFRKFPLRSVIDVVKGMELWSIGGGIFLVFVFFFISSLRWKLLLSEQEIYISLPRTFVYFLISFFIGTFLPSGLGMDVVRSIYAGGRKNFERAFISTLVDRTLGMSALIFIGFVFSFTHRNFLVFLPIYGGFLALIAALFLLIMKEKVGMVRRMTEKIKFLKEPLSKMYRAFLVYREKKKTLVNVFLLSLFLQLIFILYNMVLAWGMGYRAVLPFFVYIPLAGIVALLPISIGGLGPREATYVYLFSFAGFPSEGALALSLLSFALGLIPALLGGFLLPFFKPSE